MEMFNKKHLVFFTAAIFSIPAAFAHVSVTTAPVFAKKSAKIVLSVPHGCEGADTSKIEVTVPAELTSVRPYPGEFGAVAIESNAETVTKLTWTKSDADIQPGDTHAYEVALRATLPDAPFTTVYLPTVQYCRDAEGNETSEAWTAIGGEHDHNNPAAENPAPSAFVYPVRAPGWNKYTVNQHVHDFAVFKDAEIVWAGTAAYSPNVEIQALISAEEGVTVLDAIHPGTDIWVKY